MGRSHGASATTATGVLRASLGEFGVVVLFSLVVNILMLTVPIYLLQVSDRVLLSRSYDTLVMLTIVAVGALAVLSALDFLRRMILSEIGVRLECRLGGPVLAASVNAQVSGVPGAEAQPLSDLAQLRGFLNSPVVPQLIDLPAAPAYVAVVFLIHPLLAFIAAGGALFLLFIAFVNQRATAATVAEAGQAQRRALAQAEAHRSNAQTVKSMGMLPACIQVWGEANAKAINAESRAHQRNSVFSGVSRFVRLIIQIAILGAGAYLVLQSEITAGMMITASIIGSRALAPVEGSIEGWRSLVRARQAFTRINALLAAFPSVADRIQLPALRGRVSFEKVWLAVPERNVTILRNITFDIEPGTIIGVIGPTGAGKSSLLRIMAGAINASSGNVRIDGADIKVWDSVQLGSSIGFLPQDIQLFPGTVAANIARLRLGDVGGDAVVAAATFTGSHDLIVGLRDGYETQLQQGGAPLSGGQRQRIGLARAFLGRPKLVVLDEPDSSLDSDGIDALVQTLARARTAGETVIVATQRPSLLRHVDKVLVLKDGQVVNFGPVNTVTQVPPTTAAAASSNVTQMVRSVATPSNPKVT